MGGLKAIITDGPGCSRTKVDERGPALQFVVAETMKEVGSADGGAGGGDFDERKGGVVIDDIVGEQDFVAAAAAHVERGEVVEGPGSTYSGEEPGVFFVPEPVGRAVSLSQLNRRFRFWRLRFILRPGTTDE